MDKNHRQIQWLLQEKYGGKLTAAAKKDIEKLNAGEPVDYLIGFSEFLDCKIDLSKRPLIPRLETEYWGDRAIEELKASPKKLKVLDIFSGSGCLGVAVLKHVENSFCDFTEWDEKCLEQIKINCDLNGIDEKRYHIIRSDVFSNISGKYDYILANPPYIPKNRSHKVQPSALAYEPMMALFGGDDGMLYIAKFLHQARGHLNTNGKLFMEFDSLQKKKIEAILKEGGYIHYAFHRDQFNRLRYLVAG